MAFASIYVWGFTGGYTSFAGTGWSSYFSVNHSGSGLGRTYAQTLNCPSGWLNTRNCGTDFSSVTDHVHQGPMGPISSMATWRNHNPTDWDNGYTYLYDVNNELTHYAYAFLD